MKKSLIIAALFAAALTVSCGIKDAAIDTPEETQAVTRTFTCTFGESNTKFAIGDDGKTAWEEGDEIFIHAGTGGNKSTVVTLAASDISADGKTATITVSGLEPYDRTDAGYASTYYAIFPASAVTSTASMYYNSRLDDLTKPAMAAYDDTKGSLVFKNLFGIISYKVSGGYDEVQFFGNNGETVTYSPQCQWRVALLTNGSEMFELKLTSDGASCNPQTVISAPVTADGSTVNYICIPNGANLKNGFTFRFLKDGSIVKEATTSTSVNIAINKILPLGDISSRLTDYVAPTSHDATNPAITGATALDASATANCYIVDGSLSSNAGKVFKFKAYKGCSSNAVGNIASVDVLWETYNSAESVTANSIIAAVDFDKQSANDYYEICFKMPETLKPGNAVIAARNAGGTILWSWHIWVPATSIQTADYGVHKTNTMDRNLGALVVAEASTTDVIDITSIGMFYQWGRKDPFVGPREILEGKYPSKAKVAGAERTADKVQITVAQSIEQPTFFARGYYNGDTQENPDWCSESDASLWGDGSTKTMYDPCPPGYRVPQREKSYILWADTIADTDMQYDAEHYWVKLGTTVFPAVGWLDGGSIKTTLRLALWNVHSDSYENSYGYSHYAAYARRIYIESSALKIKNSSVNKSLGYSVRCCVE